MIDPVCGMEVTPEDAAGSYSYRGQQYYFCNESCLEQFRADPQASSPLLPGALASKPEMLPPCTLAPWIRRSASADPGACPKCGMALEPVTITAEEEANPELRLMATQILDQPGAHRAVARHRHVGHARLAVPRARLSARGCSPGWSWFLPLPLFSGEAGLFSSAAGHPW